MSQTSKLLPYNSLWLDCVKNNLMSILISYNDSLSTLPFAFKSQYWKKLTLQKFDSQETYKSLLEQGLFLPKVVYTNEILYSFFEITEIDITSSDLDSLNELIRDTLSQQKFIFLSIDRFFYPNGRESNKIHFIHPIFIHNISDMYELDNNYEAIEDCLSPGRMHYYNINFEVIYRSTKYLIDSGQNVRFMTVSLNEQKVNDYTIDYSKSILLDIRNNIAKDEIVYNGEVDLYYQVGISALEDYFDEFEEITSTLNDESIFALRTTSFIQNHKKNESIFNHLYASEGYNNMSILELAEQSRNLSNEWEVFRNSTLKCRLKKNSNDISLLKEYLQRIIFLERESIKNMRFVIV
ncbi:hypothetical protein MKX42_26510 [Paenibacillus sp. FSL R7-0204]|uniref:hypothetical protein n=1 Tax=Paenibacillus sp. FSL R7-0204 TaxID=2921675 RepID=UPI0030F8E78A